MCTCINRAFIGVFAAFGLIMLVGHMESFWPLLIPVGAWIAGAIGGLVVALLSPSGNKISDDEQALRDWLRSVNARR